jgi:hypothetical protein
MMTTYSSLSFFPYKLVGFFLCAPKYDDDGEQMS